MLEVTHDASVIEEEDVDMGDGGDDE